MEIIKLIVGLGNHGLIYKNTRHNLGFITLEYLASDYKIKLNKRACHSVYGNGFIEDKEVILVKPWTFMNLSGKAVKSLLKKFSFSHSEMLVICDDFNLELGKVRIRKKGAAGGHKGLISIINEINSLDFPRMRLGIKPEEKITDLSSLVLQPFNLKEDKYFKEFCKLASKIVIKIILEGINSTMNKYNNIQFKES